MNYLNNVNYTILRSLNPLQNGRENMYLVLFGELYLNFMKCHFRVGKMI